MAADDPEDDLGAQLEKELNEAVGAVFARHEHSMVTKWVALVETIDADGERGVWPMTSEGVKAWDTNGLLLHGLFMQQAQITAEYLSGD